MVQTRNMTSGGPKVAYFAARRQIKRKAKEEAVDDNLAIKPDIRKTKENAISKVQTMTPYISKSDIRIKNDQFNVKTKDTVLGDLSSYMRNEKQFNEFVRDVESKNPHIDIKMKGIDNYRILGLFNELTNMIKKPLKRYGAIKISLNFSYTAVLENGNTETGSRYLFSREQTGFSKNTAEIINNDTELSKLPAALLELNKEQMEKYKWQTMFIDEMVFNVYQYQPFKSGSSYMPYPPKWKHTRSFEAYRYFFIYI